MIDYSWANCSKVIKSEVYTLLSELPKLLGDNILGIYLNGSLAVGGFNPERSDINILVLTARELTGEIKREIITLLLRISRMPSPLEVYFLVENELHPFRQPLQVSLHYDEKERERYQREIFTNNQDYWSTETQYTTNLTIYLATLQQYGICLYGQAIAEAIPAIPTDIFRKALLTKQQDTQGQHLRNPINFVLNTCRTIAYLQDKNILSKSAGGAWALTHLPEQFHPLIQQALAVYQGGRLQRPVGRAMLDKFAIFIDHIIDEDK
jgi:predicted nucleotidyltransferase